MSPVEETRVITRRMRQHPDDSYTLQRYLETGGYEGLRKALSDFQPEELVELVRASGLRGRGGAGFPTGVKWSALADNFPRYLVLNDDEGEPGAFKDRELTESDPHSILEGALISAYAIRAEVVYIYLRGEFGLGFRRLQSAIDEAKRAGFIGQNILGSKFSCSVHTHRGAGAYICGEESALLDSLEGYRGQPRLRPPLPVEKGLYGQPTVVNNVETVANVQHIVLNGVDWFRSRGTQESPGTKILSVSGHVERPANYELPLGTPMADLLELAGGMKDGGKFKAVIPGGASAPMLDTLDVTLDYEALDAAVTMLGSGSIVFLNESTCMVDVAHNITRFFNHESCGKCTPCREGTWWGVKVVERIRDGSGRLEDIDVLVDVCNNMSPPGSLYRPKGYCFCGLGDGAAWALRRIIELFRDEFEWHIREKECPYQSHLVTAAS